MCVSIYVFEFGYFRILCFFIEYSNDVSDMAVLFNYNFGYNCVVWFPVILSHSDLSDSTLPFQEFFLECVLCHYNFLEFSVGFAQCHERVSI